MATRAATFGRQGKGGDTSPSLGSFVAPWLTPIPVLSLGWILNVAVATTPRDSALMGVALSLITVAVSLMAWLYGRPRGDIIQRHATATAATHLTLLTTVAIFGPNKATCWLTVAVSLAFALSWNIRRFGAIRGDGDTAGDKSDTFGLSLKRVKVIESSPDRAKAKWSLGDGQTLETVQSALPQIGSQLGTVRKGMRVSAGEREGQVTVTAVYRDVLKQTIPWSGPTHPGGSIADGFRLGMYEDVEDMWIRPAGDYERGVAPGHIGIGGMSRSGKGACAHCLLAEMATRRDIARVLLADTRKGQQFTAPIEPMIGYYADTDGKVKALARAIEVCMTERNKALGRSGFSSWSPKAFDELGIPALVVMFQEAAAYMGVVAPIVVGLAEATLSAGIWLITEAQLWKHDRMPTSLRSSVANVVCFGCAESADANYLLSATTIANGGDPGEWGTKYPGRFLFEGNGIDEERFPLNVKGLFVPAKVLAPHVEEWAPRMAPYHAIDLAAFDGLMEPYVPEPVTGGLQRMRGSMTRLTSAEAPPWPDDDETDDDDEDEFDDPELEKEVHVTPKMDDPELDAAAARIDPREELPGVTPDVDLSTPNTSGRTWTKEEKEIEFGRMLAALADAGPLELDSSKLSDEWAARVGDAEALKSWQFHDLINAWIEAGQVERLKQGRYRLSNIVTVGATS